MNTGVLKSDCESLHSLFSIDYVYPLALATCHFLFVDELDVGIPGLAGNRELAERRLG